MKSRKKADLSYGKPKNLILTKDKSSIEENYKMFLVWGFIW